MDILYKRTKTGAIQTWEIIIDGGAYFTKEGQQGGKITQSNPTKCKAKNVGRANETTPETQAIKEAKSKWDKKLKTGYTVDVTNVDNVDMFYEPMLAKKYEDYKDKLTFPCYIQGKLDGIRCVSNFSCCRSRKGETFQSTAHIQDLLKPVFELDKLAILDGELYNHELNNDFSKIQSLVVKKKLSIIDVMEITDVLQYHVYDVPKFGVYDESDLFSDRFFAFKKFYDEHPEMHSAVRLVPTYEANSYEEIDDYLDRFLEDGYEGAIIRVNDKYHNKRSNSLLKYKKFIDEEYKILDIHHGRGNKANMAAKMRFMSKSGHYFNASIKGKHERLKEILIDKDHYIGKMATVKYFNLTPDKQIPRFPYVVKIDRCDV